MDERVCVLLNEAGEALMPFLVDHHLRTGVSVERVCQAASEDQRLCGQPAGLWPALCSVVTHRLRFGAGHFPAAVVADVQSARRSSTRSLFACPSSAAVITRLCSASTRCCDRVAGDGDGDGGIDRGEPLTVYGDAAYGAGQVLQVLEAAGAQVMCKVAPTGRLAKDQFTVDLPARAVRCPAGVTTSIRPAGTGGGMAYFGTACAGCPLAAQCTAASGGRTISVGRYEEQLGRARAAQQDPRLAAGLPCDPAMRVSSLAASTGVMCRPKVERKSGI